ncbi:MAG: bacillithiol biosynthesis deacetylase BshB1 [Cytophagales bacterium]|nr:bacillithiol biosynthesis deacetylase BshB1 [Bernardetiaceae bacterium]MDW8205227.1 bacillithiol biosynthesis deacetylase BshB1 [Cytophagales bacterium]
MKLDILAIMAHPDDAELGCGGTLIAHIAQGYKVGIIDLTAGELGTNGTVETRAREAAEAARIMGLAVRENMGFKDGFFANDEAHQRALITQIRRFQPRIVIANAIQDRHPDHARAAQLTEEACFLAGLKKIATVFDGKPQQAWRPEQVFHMLQSNYVEPDLIVDISDYWEQKMQAILAYQTQFYLPGMNNEPTFIATPEFLDFLKGRAREMGQAIRKLYGEGFTVSRKIGVRNLFDTV